MTSLDTPQTNLTFQLTIPPSWMEFDLAPATRDQAIREAVEDRVRDIPTLWRRRSDIVRYIRAVARDAWDNGARYCATFVEPAGDGLILGALTVTVLPPVKATGRTTISDLLRETDKGPINRADGEWRMTEPLEIAGAGRAVRQWGVQAIAPKNLSGSAPFVFTHTFVPTANAVLLVSCVSPSADVADPLLALFAEVTDSLILTAAEA